MSLNTGFTEELPTSSREYKVGEMNPGGGPPFTKLTAMACPAIKYRSSRKAEKT